MENPWNIQSIYDLLYFNCPSCVYKNHSKQDLINHASDFHPESIEFLKNIKDKSLIDIVFPCQLEPKINIKTEEHQPEENYEIDKNIYNTDTVSNIKSEKVDDIDINVDQYHIVKEEAFDYNNDEHNKEMNEGLGNFNMQDYDLKEIKEDPLTINVQDTVKYNDPSDMRKKAFVDKIMNLYCEYCGKKFTRADSQKRHIKIVHEGRKDFKCETCGKEFSEKAHLKQHIRTVHEGHKEYKCETCNSEFAHLGSLKMHIKTVHEGIKDHKCGICGKDFSRKQDVKYHIKIVHERQKDFECEICGKKFGYKNYLKLHSEKIHGIIL